MKIRKEIRPNKSLSSMKKNNIPSIIRYEKTIMNKLESTNSSSVEGGFDTTQTVTSTPSHPVTGKNPSTQTIPIIVCLATMCLLIIFAIIFIFHYKRKYNNEKNENENENSVKLTKITNEVSVIISESNSMSDDDIESKRSSGSSFLAIEVMTNTLSNIIKQQGGKIKVADPNNISATNDLVKVKSLDLLEQQYHRDTSSKSSRRVNSFISMANNIFGKSS